MQPAAIAATIATAIWHVAVPIYGCRLGSNCCLRLCSYIDCCIIHISCTKRQVIEKNQHIMVHLYCCLDYVQLRKRGLIYTLECWRILAYFKIFSMLICVDCSLGLWGWDNAFRVTKEINIYAIQDTDWNKSIVIFQSQCNISLAFCLVILYFFPYTILLI